MPKFDALVRKAGWMAIFGVVAGLAGPPTAYAQSVSGFGLTATPPSTLAWDAVTDPSSTTAKITYIVRSKVGLVKPAEAVYGNNGNPVSPGGDPEICRVFDKTTCQASTFAPICFIVQSSSPASGIFGVSQTACHAFTNTKPFCSSNGDCRGTSRGDGSGTQLGFNQKWNFGYFLDGDALVTLKVFYPTATFTTSGVDGLTRPADVTQAIRTVLDAAPRSYHMNDGSFENKDFWDSRDSSGSLVGNNIYRLWWQVKIPGYNPGTVDGVVDAFTMTVPVDIIRISAFSTEGILAGGSVAKINYTVTADASVRIVIAKPGTKFVLDSQRKIQALGCPGSLTTCTEAQLVIDESTKTVVQVISFNKSAGSVSETWNGTDSNGVAVSSGIYAVGISAVDGYGNLATGPDGDQAPIAGTIPVDRTAAQVAIDNTPPTVSSVAVQGILIDTVGGSTVPAFTEIRFTLNETAAANSQVTLTHSGGFSPAGGVTASGNDVIYTVPIQNSTGTWTVTVTARDVSGNSTSQLSRAFSMLGPAVSSVTVGGLGISLTGATIEVSPFSTIKVRLNTNVGGSTVTLKLNNNLLAGTTEGAGADITFSSTYTVSFPGTYSLEVQPRDSAQSPGTTKTFSFSLAAPVQPTVSTLTVGGVVVAPTGTTQVNPFSSIQITLSATASTNTVVALSFGSVQIAGSTAAASNTITFTPTTTVSSTGTYTLNVTPVNISGTQGSLASYSFSIATPAPSPGATMTADAFKAAVKPLGNPVRTSPMRVQFQVANNAGVDFDLYTLSGQRVFHQTQSYAAGTQQFNWSLVNQAGNPVASGVYILRITANDGQNVLKATKKVMILR